jgi:hypothetical protein
MTIGKTRISLEKRKAMYQAIHAAYQAIIKARESVAGVFADMNHEIQNNHYNKVGAAARFAEEAVEAGDAAVQMDTPLEVKVVIGLAQKNTLEMRMFIYEDRGEYEMKELLSKAITAALLAEQEWRKAKEMLEEQMGGRRRSNRSKRNRSKRNRTHRTHRK